jgi:hypothetical protein
MKVRTAKLEELIRQPKERRPSPRQLAAMRRGKAIRRAFGRLKTDDDIIAIELASDDKLPTVRAAVKRGIVIWRPELNMRVRGRTIYVSPGSLPGTRKKSA